MIIAREQEQKSNTIETIYFILCSKAKTNIEPVLISRLS